MPFAYVEFSYFYNSDCDLYIFTMIDWVKMVQNPPIRVLDKCKFAESGKSLNFFTFFENGALHR